MVAQLQTATLNIVGVGTHWLQGETTLSFGGGVNDDSLTVTSPTTAQVQITCCPVRRWALLTADSQSPTAKWHACSRRSTSKRDSRRCWRSRPNAGEQGDTLTVQVLGRFTTSRRPRPTVAFNQDITVNSINVIDSDNMQAEHHRQPVGLCGLQHAHAAMCSRLPQATSR